MQVLDMPKKKDIPLVVTYHGDWDANYGNFLERLGVSITNRLTVDKLLFTCGC